MMIDPFANYVVQRVVDVASPAQRTIIMAIIQQQLPQLRRFTHGKHILSRLEKYEKMGGQIAGQEPLADQKGPVIPGEATAANADGGTSSRTGELPTRPMGRGKGKKGAGDASGVPPPS
jgi:hypothetical protein